jgi:uncharacterized membrane protein YagU involved in acid resistance
MAFMKIKQSAWDQIKAAVAHAAESAGDRAEHLRGVAVDAYDRLEPRLQEGVSHVRDGASHVRGAVHDGVHASADAVRGGASAVGRGVRAVDRKVEDVADGVVAGAIAGALAAWVMNQFQAASAKPVAQRKLEAAAPPSTEDNATTRAAEKVVGREIPDALKPAAGAAVHYGYGAAMGALYGGLSELVPTIGTGLGIPYATALWLFGDEIAVPALGLSKPPAATTPAEHASALSAHFVYGVTLDIARRILRRIV